MAETPQEERICFDSARTPHICSTKWVDSKVEVEGEDTGFARIQGLQRVLCRNFGLINLEELDKNYEKDMYLASGQVLVDAECTHDGSLKHILKYEHWGWETMERRVLDHERLASITSLQLLLLTNGFRLLKAGGTLVYSTCSLTNAQNEEVVETFLSGHSNAELVEIEECQKSNWPCENGKLPHTLRFNPISSSTSGLFLAKIKKCL
ncbi:hypothetical protein L7F22_002677 [Adiantum nelumboides]|nr:hypothetical protein [Adiantum nelumboides]